MSGIRGARPSRLHLALLRPLVHLTRPLFRFALLLVGRVHLQSRNGANVPRRGGVIVLSNHISLYDPLFLTIAAQRPIQFLGADALLQRRSLRLMLTVYGYVAKQKLRNDLIAIRALRRWCNFGAAVAVFPEGQRSWDSRPVSVLPGIEKLVRMFGVPLVTARIINSDRQDPFWALHRRRGVVMVEFDPPRTFARSTPLPEIRRYITERIGVDPEHCRRWPVRGSNLAAGLTNLLFACPACSAYGGLREAGDTVRCRRCHARWQVTTSNSLDRVDRVDRVDGLDSAQSMTVTAAFDRIRADLDRSGWQPHAAAFAASGVVLQSGPDMLVVDATRIRPRRAGRGRLTLTATQLETRGELPWQLPLADIVAVTVDIRTRLRIQTRDRAFEVELRAASAIEWTLLTNHWRDAARRMARRSA